MYLELSIHPLISFYDRLNMYVTSVNTDKERDDRWRTATSSPFPSCAESLNGVSRPSRFSESSRKNGSV